MFIIELNTKMSFIENVVTNLLDNQIDLSKTQIILPGKRPIIFFKRYFSEKEYTGFLPKFITIEDFVALYSDLVKIENIPLWFEAYTIQKQFINPEENLEDFLKWVPTLLKDFNDIDIFSKDPMKVLEHLTSIERLENWSEILDTGDKEKLFYKNIKFWENNVVLYKELKASLLNKGLGTQGMILHSAIQHLKNTKLSADQTFVFAGFNAITPNEEILIKHFVANYHTLLYWDSDEYYMKKNNQESGYFLRKFVQWNYYANREFLWTENNFSQKKNIHVVSTSQDVAQAKYAGKLLENLTEYELQKTALVLCDETILPSVMESLPENVKRVNITMGYSLKNSILASFFKQIFQLHIFREKNKAKGYYYKDVLSILNHPLLENNSDVYELCEEINTYNLVFISNSLLYDKLSTWELFFIFTNFEHPIDLLQKLYDFCNEKFWTYSEQQAILKENFLKFKNVFSILISQLSQNFYIDNFTLLYSFYQHILTNEKIDFIGEPLEGLQLMGVLETRLLGFENIIMLGVNEGVIPAGRSDNSFIPFDVKKNYDIHTFLENDAIYAYHFYRLLQHANSIHLIYNNFTEGLNSGEKSRFISQLEFESPHTIHEITASYSGELESEKELTIEKTPALIKAIKNWLKNPVSPTHLTSYHYDPISFYLQKILELGEKSEIEEEISPLNYGNLIHHTLESLYSPLKSQYLEEKSLLILLDTYKDHLNEYIAKELNADLFDRGQNYLQKLLAEKTVEKIILRDLNDIRNGHSIFLNDIEKKLTSHVSIESLGKIQLKGFADRWDIFDGQDRIIDYKTSSVGSLNFKADQLSEIKNNKNFKFFIQLIFYAYIVLNEKSASTIQVGIWSFKKPFKGIELLNFDNNTIFTYPQACELFKEITSLIKEIADPNQSFVKKI